MNRDWQSIWMVIWQAGRREFFCLSCLLFQLLIASMRKGCSCVLMAVTASTFRLAAADTLEQVDLPSLLDPATRKAEVVAMLARQDAASKYNFKRNDFRVVSCPQGNGGESLQVVLVDYGEMIFSDRERPGDYATDGLDELFPPVKHELVDKTTLAGPGLEQLDKDVITIFGPNGREIRPFGGNNMINSGYLADFNDDGVMDRLDHTNYGVDKALDVQVLELRSVERVPKPILNVIFNWHPRRDDKADVWDYECFDEDGDGLIEIGFGPENSERRRDVVFRWDPARGVYQAEGLDRQPHLRVLANAGDEKQLVWQQLKEIKAAGGLSYPLLTEVREKNKSAVKEAGPPTPYQFQSLKGRSDEDIASAMGGKPAADEFRPADAPDTHLPEGFWEMDPKSAALAFVEANRKPAHREMVRIAIDDRNQVQPPAAGWVVHDFASSSCYVSSTSLTALRFGIDQPYVFHADSSRNGFVGANPLADRAGHALRLIPVSKDEARFLSETLFWLDRIRSRSSNEDRFGGGMSSTADGSGALDFHVGNQEPRRVKGTLWNGPSLASRWTDEYDQEACINFADYLLTDALPKHLKDRWNAITPLEHRSLVTPLADRLKPREDSDERDELAAIVLTALERHQTDPWPATVLALLVNFAGDSGLSKTLPDLGELAGNLPPPCRDEAEFRKLEIQFKGHFSPPDDQEGKKQWDRYQVLTGQMAYDVPYQLREPLLRAINQLRAIYQPGPLIKLADGNDASAAWALQQLQIHHPEAYADILIANFHEADPGSRRMIFSTLATVYPPGAMLLRDMLTPQQITDLAIPLAQFEQEKEPALAQSRIPELLEIAKDLAGTRDYNERGPAIELLSALPLDGPQRAQFDILLLAELKSPQRRPFKISVLPWITAALIKQPVPDRHWDALVAGSGKATEFSEFYPFLDALSALALARPDPRMAQLGDFMRPCFTKHGGLINELFVTALALDLRELAPEIARLASSGPDVEEGKCANGRGGGFTGPGNERYHLARNVTGLWSETDADSLAKMWVGLVIAHPGDFCRTSVIALKLRERFRAALAAASPEVNETLTADIRTLTHGSPYLLAEPN